MAIVTTDDKHYKGIANVIREILETNKKYKPDEITQGIDDVFLKGFDAGVDEGKQAQYDLFWDKFQKNGTRTDYQYAFANWVSSEEIFKPKYDIKPVGGAQRMFHGFQTSVSLPDVCEECGIVMDFSKVTSFEYFMYNYCAISRIGIVDCSSVTNLNRAFLMASSLKTIDKLIVHEGITSYTDCFANAIKLQNITIEGTIAGTGFSVSSHSELTHDSLFGKIATQEQRDAGKNILLFNGEYYYGGIIIALKDYSGTTTTKTVTLGATNLAKLTDAEKAIATQKGWSLA